jgi:hypothetical protein
MLTASGLEEALETAGAALEDVFGVNFVSVVSTGLKPRAS